MNLLKEKYGMDLFKTITNILVILAIAYFVYGQFFLPKDTTSYKEQVEAFNDDWYEIKEDGTREKISLPGSYDKTITMEAKLPENLGPAGCYMVIRGEKTEVYVDGELRINYDNSKTRAFGNEVTETYVIVQLYPEDAGKVITVTITGMAGVVYQVDMGTQLGIWMKVLNRYGSELLVGILTIFLGILAVICGVVLHNIYKRPVSLIYLAIGICCGALWIVFNSAIRDLYFNNIGMATDMCFIIIMLTPFPILIYLNELQQRRYEKLYFITSAVELITFVICTLLHVLGIYDFHRTFAFAAGSCALCMVTIGISIFGDIKNKKIKEYSFVAIGLLSVVLSALIQIVTFMHRRETFSGVFLAIGFMLMLIFAVVHTMVDISKVIDHMNRAEMASEAKGKFLANMSHEIRTPVNAILGMNEMILREARSPEIIGYASDIKSASKSLLSIINDILDISKIEAGKMELVKIEYEFGALLHDLIIMVRPKAKAKNLQFKLEIDENIPNRLFGDNVRLQQILLNILGNAVKYTEEGTITFRVSGARIEQSVNRNAEDENKNLEVELQGDNSVFKDILLHFEVEDTGIGIRKEDIAKLFDEFERFDLSKNNGIEGTGLGMSITNRLLQLMDSKLMLESEYGKGSIFSFDVKQKVLAEEKIGNVGREDAKSTKKNKGATRLIAPGAKVLVVDDKALNRKVFCNLLKKMEMSIDEADSGESCLKLAKETDYDIIFMDHMMPGMDGVETLHVLRKSSEMASNGSVVVALTANAISGAKEKYISEGFTDYLSKPIIPENLEAILRQYLMQCKEIDVAIENAMELADRHGDASYNNDINKEKNSENIPARWSNEDSGNITMAVEESNKKENNNMNENSIESIIESIIEKLNLLPEIDVNKAREFTPDDELYVDIIKDFQKVMTSDIEEVVGYFLSIKDSVETQEENTNPISGELAEVVKQYRIKVHSMKSSAMMIGAVTLSEEAKKLEFAARDENIELILSDTEKFLDNWARYEEMLAFVNEKPANLIGAEKLSAEEYKTTIFGVLGLLENAMEDLDIDQADGIIKLLAVYDFGEDIQKEVDALAQAVNKLEIDETKDIIKTIKDKM